MAENGQDRLESWKEIAVAIGRDTRTAMRWAKERGMPVHRVPGGERGRVFASRSEIERWLQGTSKRDSNLQVAVAEEESPLPATPSEPETTVEGTTAPKTPRRRWHLWVTAVLAADILCVGALARWRAGRAGDERVPARVTFTEDAVHAFSENGRELWSHSYAHPLDHSALAVDKGFNSFVRIADLRGDGEKEVLLLAAWRLGPNPEDATHDEIECFSSAGKLLWTYSPNRQFQFGDHELTDRWGIYDLHVSEGNGRAAIWVAVGHTIWGNSFVVELDPNTGRDSLRFVNTGTTSKLAELQVGGTRYLLASGFNNEYDGGSLSIVDERGPFAVSPQTAGTRHKCVSCPGGVPDYYLVFPRSEINRLTATYPNFVEEIHVDGNEVELTKFELPESSGTSTMYRLRLQDGIQPVSIRYDSTYDMRHRELSAQHKLNHSLENCPERLHPLPVRVWTPAHGWSEIHFKPARADQ